MTVVTLEFRSGRARTVGKSTRQAEIEVEIIMHGSADRDVPQAAVVRGESSGADWQWHFPPEIPTVATRSADLACSTAALLLADDTVAADSGRRRLDFSAQIRLDDEHRDRPLRTTYPTVATNSRRSPAQPLMSLYRLWTQKAPWLRGRGLVLRTAAASARLGVSAPIVSGPDGVSLQFGMDYLTRAVLATGAFEPRLIAALQAATPKGGVFVDVGANVGFVSTLASRWVGSAGRVYAFEPSRTAHARLLANLALNDCVNVETLRVGCSSSRGELRLATPGIELGLAHVVERDDEGAQVESISVTTIDAFVASRALARVDVLKIDVEGHDFEVLRGAAETIRTFHPAISIEVGSFPGRTLAESVVDVLTFLHPHGYRAQLIEGEGAFDLVCIPCGA